MSSEPRGELVKQLRQLGVETVTAEYDGVGDSGQIEEPDFSSAGVTAEMALAVQNLFYDLLEEEYLGWEINEGSFGQFTWHVREDRINLVHNIRMETETEEQDL